MNIQKSVAFVKADLKTINFLQLKPYKTVNIWHKNELFEMVMVEWNENSQKSIQSISNISSLPVFLLDSNNYLTVYENGRNTKIGNLISLSSTEASNKDFFIKDSNKENFFGVM